MQALFMASPISFCNRTKKQPCLPSLMHVFLFLYSLNFVFSKTSAAKCSLDFQFPLFKHTDPTSEDENWSGFLSNHCGAAFESYLYALANRANRTGQIFLSLEEQKDCLISLQSIDSDAFDCGLEKLTGGNGGCSDYNVADIAEKLEKRTDNLREDCKFSDSENYDEICSKCSKRWIEMDSSSDNGNEVEKSEAMVCRFAVLVRLTSNRIDDQDWIQSLYKCLGNYSFSSDEKLGFNGINVNTSTGLWIVCGGVLGIVVVILIAAWILWGRKIDPRTCGQTTVLRPSSSLSSACIKMTAQEIHLATDNLDPVNFIGQGVAGKVYKGRLSNGQHVAVKHIINDGQLETFIREVKSLAHIRHPNLVTLIGYYEGKDQYFLVYELCRHRSLSEWLFGKDKNLSWIQRLTIAIDSARGLLFLHNYHEGCIVHRDIKPANILIGANFQAKLSDFGLSKVMNIGQSFVSSEVRGTFGYIDPEYRRNHHVKASGDVYSLGIVLLQLLSGKRVINLNMQTPMPLDKMARRFASGNDSTEFADPKLHGDFPAEAFGVVLNLALSCTGPKKQRPSMEEVMFKLEIALKLSREVECFVSEHLMRLLRGQTRVVLGWQPSIHGEYVNPSSASRIAGFDIFNAAIPFGGYKMDGTRREKGIYSLSNCLQLKAVVTPRILIRTQNQ